MKLTNIIFAKEARYKRVYAVWFHFYKIWKQAKRIYAVKKSGCGDPWGGVVAGRGTGRLLVFWSCSSS